MGIAFDDGAAEALISAADSAEQALRAEGGFLGGAVDRALEDFSGGYARLFTEACMVRAEDRGRLAGVLADLADDVRDAKLRAREEKSRQKDLDAWQHRADVREQELMVGDLVHKSVALASMVIDPMPSQMPVAAPTISAAFAAHDRRRFAGGSGDGTKTSADPAKLRGFAGQSCASDNALGAEFSSVRNAWSGFTTSCSWVNIEAASFVSGFERLLAENAADADWVEQIAGAFETAGGGSLGDAVLNGIFIGYASPGQVSLNDVAAMNTVQLKAWLGNSLNIVWLQGILKQPGLDPVVTAAWWAGLGQTVDPDTGKVTVGEKQHLLIDALPELIGNLNGVPATARDIANRKRLEMLHEHWKSYRQDHVGDVDESSQEGMVNKVWEALYNADGTKKVADADDGSSIYQIVSFIPYGLKQGSDTGYGASISVGDLDAAQNVTYQVPGLNTIIGHDITAKTLQATDQRLDQRTLAFRSGINPNRIAVVAWMGVEPARELGVFSNDQAKVVGAALDKDLTGFNAVHQNLGNTARTTVVGHSYGSLGAMEAAKSKLPVDNLVLVGDIGTPDNVISVNDLHLNPGGTVYRGTYNEDTTAGVGHGIGWYRKYTTDSGFGAVTFGTDGATAPDGTIEHPTKTHGGQTGGKDGIYGYFDRNTESTNNQAKIALGLNDQLTNVKR
jgi:hypothetical protein